jgi:hypothetical protein
LETGNEASQVSNLNFTTNIGIGNEASQVSSFKFHGQQLETGNEASHRFNFKEFSQPTILIGNEASQVSSFNFTASNCKLAMKQVTNQGSKFHD